MRTIKCAYPGNFIHASRCQSSLAGLLCKDGGFFHKSITQGQWVNLCSTACKLAAGYEQWTSSKGGAYVSMKRT